MEVSGKLALGKPMARAELAVENGFSQRLGNAVRKSVPCG
jgi:hypothetical protein